VPRRPSAVTFLVLASLAAALARGGDDANPPPAKSAEPVRFGPPPAGLRLEIRTPKTAYEPGERIRPEVALVNGSERTLPVVIPRCGSETGSREPSLTWTAAYVAADGKETPVVPVTVGRCGTGIDFVWQDDVVALKAGERVALAQVEDPAVTLDLQAAGKVRLVLRYAYSAGAGTKAPAVANVPKDAGAMGAQAPFEIVQAVDVTVERPLDVVVESAGAARAGSPSRLAGLVNVRAVSRDGEARTLDASIWSLQFEFEAPPALGLDTAKCWEKVPLARSAQVAASGTTALAFDAAMACGAATPGTCRVRAVLSSAEPGGPRIRSAWTEMRFRE
jgi:hypothetical protein